MQIEFGLSEGIVVLRPLTSLRVVILEIMIKDAFLNRHLLQRYRSKPFSNTKEKVQSLSTNS